MAKATLDNPQFSNNFEMIIQSTEKLNRNEQFVFPNDHGTNTMLTYQHDIFLHKETLTKLLQLERENGVTKVNL